MGKVHVLIVEDEPIIAADLADRLSDMGYEVSGICDSGEAAHRVFAEQNIDLVLMDIQLDGDWDGVETAEKLLKIRPVPIIYLTSNTDQATFARARHTAPAAFFSKPFRGKDLQHAIELAISNVVVKQESTPVVSDTFVLKDRLFVKVKDRMVRVFYDEVLWFEANDYYCNLVTAEKEILITQTLKTLEEMLRNVPGFVRVHRSYIVNLDKIEEIGDTYVRIQKKQIPINKASKDTLSAYLQKL